MTTGQLLGPGEGGGGAEGRQGTPAGGTHPTWSCRLAVHHKVGLGHGLHTCTHTWPVHLHLGWVAGLRHVHLQVHIHLYLHAHTILPFFVRTHEAYTCRYTYTCTYTHTLSRLSLLELVRHTCLPFFATRHDAYNCRYTHTLSCLPFLAGTQATYTTYTFIYIHLCLHAHTHRHRHTHLSLLELTAHTCTLSLHSFPSWNS